MKKAAKTRQFIIEQTAPIFNKKGFAGTSLSDLTQATGLTKGSIYGNFKNKDEVAIAAFEHNIGKIENLLRQLMAEAPSPLDKLKAYVAFYRSPDFMPAYRLGCPIVNAAPEADDTHPLLKEKVNQTILRWDKNIQTLIRKGIEAGQIKEDTEAAVFSARMIALIEGGSLISKSTGDWRFLEEALKQLEGSISAISQ